MKRNDAFVIKLALLFLRDFCYQGSLLAGKTRQPYCLYCTRVTLISMEEGTLPRHFISMEERILGHSTLKFE